MRIRALIPRRNRQQNAGGAGIKQFNEQNKADGLVSRISQIGPVVLTVVALIAVLLTGSLPSREQTPTATPPRPAAAQAMQAATYTSYPQISAGDGHTCMVAVNQVGFCWGGNGSYQLGDGTTTTRMEPTVVKPGTLWISLQAGYNFSCGIDSINDLYCWGANSNGQVGDGTIVNKTTPTKIGSLKWKSVSVSRNADACGITTGNALYCWGSNRYGQIANGVVGGAGSYVNAPYGPIGGATQWKQVSTGYATSCAIRSDDTLWCWGINGYGMLGQAMGSGSMAQSANPLQLTTQAYTNPTTRRNVGGWSHVAVGFYTVCGIGLDNTGYCWGRGLYGQLGINDTNEMWDPHQILTASSWTDIRVGDDHACGVATGGNGYCWGRGANYQTGVNSTADQLVPVQVSGTWSMISGGYIHSCGVLSTGWPKCWGGNTNGMSGRGDATTPITTPVNAYVVKTVSSTGDVTQAEGNSGTSTFSFSVTLSGYTSVPVTATIGTTNGTATAGSDFVAGSGTMTIQPGATTGTVDITVNGDNVVEPNENFTMNLSAPSANITITDGSGTGTITNDDVNVAPNTPASLVQTKSDTSALATGGWTATNSVIMTANITDTGVVVDTSALCVEVVPSASAFTNTETACGTAVGYSNSGVAASVTVPGLSDGVTYKWQARSKDSFGVYSAWVNFNTGTTNHFGIDMTGPTPGSVRDGNTQGSDASVNDGTLTQMAFNWSSFNDGNSGVASYQYSIGTTPGATDTRSWTTVASSPYTATGLTLRTGQSYYVSVRAIDNVGNIGSTVATSDGQTVAPVLTFTMSSPTITFDDLAPVNSFVSTNKTLSISVFTNAYNGYVVRQYGSPQLNMGATTTPMFAGTYASPAAFTGSGLAYNSNDTSISTNGDLFAGGTKFARPNSSAPGDIVADRSSPTTVTDNYTLTYAFGTPPTQAAGAYTNSLVIQVIPTF